MATPATHDPTEPYLSAPGTAQVQRDAALEFALTFHRHAQAPNAFQQFSQAPAVAADVLVTASAFLSFLRGEH